jgi:hemoglobin
MSAPADEELQRVERMVRRFYELGLADPVLGPIFRNAIHDWEPHIAVVRDFWSGAIHGTQRYLGNAYAPHARLVFGHEAFAHWLQAFETAVQEVLTAPEAERAIRIARHMAQSFEVGLFPFTDAQGRPSRRP